MLLLLILAVMTAMALPIAIVAYADPVVGVAHATCGLRPAVRYLLFAVQQRPRPPTAS
ncbi:MAG TPA: hypothetical protein VJ901_15050 [Thermoanaerobaculia bacterium]|nr:hypothetical protein [Thermoanaerobaculia bacterium]